MRKGLGYHNRRSAFGFSPASLFASGEQGAWYDPSDLTTLFTTSDGTTPVTAVEQSVGLMLDKSKGGRQSLPITGWVKDSGDGVVTVNGGTITITGATTTTRVDIAAPGWVVGNYADITINGTVSGAVTPLLFIGGSPLAIVAGTNTYRSLISGSNLCRVQVTSGSATFDITSRGIVPGNHAYQSTSTSRPVLRALYNLLTYTEQFDNAAWTRTNFLAFGSGSIVNAIAAPDGTVTADLLTESTAASANFFFNQTTVLSSSTTYTYSIYCKPNGRSRLYLAGSSTAWGAGFITFDLNTLVVSPSGGGGWTGTISSLPDGWYRITATRTTNSGLSGGYLLSLFFLNNSGNVTYTGDGVSGMYFWGAQLIVTNSLPSNQYQRVVVNSPPGSGVYDTAGFLPYLFFDGTDDSLLTNSVDFTATDKMTVWAGVRKLSDATARTLCELGASPATVDGMFALSPGDYATGTGAYWAHGARGTAALNSNQYAVTPASFASPITNVLTGTSDIAGDLSVIRANGVQQATATGDKGAGNFSNNPLYIGRRNNATQPFNGQLFSLIVRGAQSSAAQISSTETWVAQKTGVTL